MRKIILTIAAATVVGFAGPALADMTLPAGAYAQAPATASVEAPAYYATADQSPRAARPFHHSRVHQY